MSVSVFGGGQLGTVRPSDNGTPQIPNDHLLIFTHTIDATAMIILYWTVSTARRPRNANPQRTTTRGDGEGGLLRMNTSVRPRNPQRILVVIAATLVLVAAGSSGAAAAATPWLAESSPGGAGHRAPQPDPGEIRNAGLPTAVPGSYIVVLKDDSVAAGAVAATAADLAASYRGRVGRVYTAALRGFEVSMAEADAKRLAAHPSVAFVQQNQVVTGGGSQETPPSWGLDRIDERLLPLDSFYRFPNTAPSVEIYIIDSGIRLTHADFAGRAVSGIDTIDGGSADDCHGHGTHVAGTAGGTSFGVAKSVTLVAVRVLDCFNSGTTASVVAGVDWVTADHDPGELAVANMSLGGPVDLSLDTAVVGSIADGITYTTIADNQNIDACNRSPARVSAAITVGATDTFDRRAFFSNFGTCLDLFAPGVNIVSAWNGFDLDFRPLSGTSQAAPHVAGVAAMILQANPFLTPQQVRNEIVADATIGIVTDPGLGSPNQLLFVDNGPPQPPCATSAQVFLVNDGIFPRFETDPIEAPTFDFSVPADTPITFALGGNGLRPNEDPFWDVFDQSGQYVRTVVGSRAGINCVSDQRSFTDSAPFGTVHTYRATYAPGNSGGIVRSQAHFRLHFDTQNWTEVPPGGGFTLSGPAATGDLSGQFAFVRGTDDRIYLNRFNGTTWTGWGEIPGGGSTQDAPAATMFGTGRVHVFVRGGNSIYLNRFINGVWSGWGEVPGGGQTFSAPTAATLGGNLYLFVRGTDNGIWVNRFNGTTWTGWSPVPGGGSTEDAPAAAVFGNRLHLFVRGGDRVYENRFDGVTWTGWGEVPGNGRIQSAPAAATSSTGLNLVVRSADDHVFLNRLADNGVWNGWRDVSQIGITRDAPGATALGNRLTLFIRGLDDRIYLNNITLT